MSPLDVILWAGAIALAVALLSVAAVVVVFSVKAMRGTLPK